MGHFVRWNQKFLDYEIETNPNLSPEQITGMGWNQKFLDYEIETCARILLAVFSDMLESKVSRLRD